jgi:hypothetical protein
MTSSENPVKEKFAESVKAEVQLPRTPFWRSSQNKPSPKVGE